MNKKKGLYEAPITKVREVRFEESLLALSNNIYGSQGSAGGDLEDGNEYDL